MVFLIISSAMYKETFNVVGVHFTVACEQRHFDHNPEMLDFKNTMWMDCHFSRVGILGNCSTANPLNSPCTVGLLKTHKSLQLKPFQEMWHLIMKSISIKDKLCKKYKV